MDREITKLLSLDVQQRTYKCRKICTEKKSNMKILEFSNAIFSKSPTTQCPSHSVHYMAVYLYTYLWSGDCRQPCVPSPVLVGKSEYLEI
jgi:hypothetical protein